jgi:serine/threonine-protein kinase RsbW
MCSQPEDTNSESRTVKGTREAFDEIQDNVLARMIDFQYTETDLFSVRVAIEEALANALLHGHQGDKGLEIEVSWKVDGTSVEISVKDQGRGYDPNMVPDPTADENLTLPSGRGVAMMRSFMDEVLINERGNKVTMVRHALRDE